MHAHIYVHGMLFDRHRHGRPTSAFDTRALDQFERGFWCMGYSYILQEQLGRPQCFNPIPEEMVLPGWAYHILPISVAGSLLFSQPVWGSLVGGSRSPKTCFVVNRDHLNSARLELLVLKLVNSTSVLFSLSLSYASSPMPFVQPRP